MSDTSTVQEIYTDRIRDPKDPMRSELDRAGLFELADNIKQNGLINPITVRPFHALLSEVECAAFATNNPCPNLSHFFYEVVAGHRRLSACRIAGLIRIACVVRDLDDNKSFEIMAAENLERADVDPLDEAVFVGRYLDHTGKSIAEIAKGLRRSVQWVESRLAVGVMPDYLQDALKRNEIKLGVALALAQITDDPTRRVWVDLAIRDGVSVAQAEYWLHGWQVGQLPGAAAATLPPDGYAAAAPAPITMECAVDGKSYDARTMRALMIHEGNLQIFGEFARQYRALASENINPAEPSPVSPPSS